MIEMSTQNDWTEEVANQIALWYSLSGLARSEIKELIRSSIPPQPPIPQSVRELAANITHQLLDVTRGVFTTAEQQKRDIVVRQLQSFLTTHNAETIRVLERANKLFNEIYHFEHLIEEGKTVISHVGGLANEGLDCTTTHLNKLKEGK